MKLEKRRGDWTRAAAMLLLGGWALMAGPRIGAQAARSQEAAAQTASVAGKVVTEDGAAVDGATIEVRAAGATGTAQTVLVSDAAGKFRGRVTAAGVYTVLARAQGGQSASATVQVQRGEERVVRLMVSGPKSADAAVEFSDKPNFAVAGVTDWTAVGGHGSDATLRTSEDLARETLRLKAANATPGRVMGEGSQGTESEGRLRAAAVAEPKSYEANHALGMYHLRARQFSAAEPWLRAASTLSGGAAEDEYELAQACLGLGDLSQAREHAERALAKKDAGEYHRVAGEIAERMGDPLVAVRQEEMATKLSPSEENYFAWGSELLLHRAIWQAAEVFEHGAMAHPDSARMKTGWGAALFGEALYDKAAKALCAASDQSPDDAETYGFLGKVGLASPEPLPCVQETLRRYLTLRPDSAEANYFAAMYAVRHGGAANTAEVERLLRRATALDPKMAEAYLQLGILAFQRRNYAEAMGLYRQAIAADPKLPEPHYRLGVAYDRTGDAAKAKQEFEIHAACEHDRAEATEQQRREVKQFLVVLGDKGGAAGGGA